jgi:hypothetical protein
MFFIESDSIFSNGNESDRAALATDNELNDISNQSVINSHLWPGILPDYICFASLIRNSI